MSTVENQAPVETQNENTETTTTEETTEAPETVTIPKSDYDKLNSDLGSLKRENKSLKKSKEQTEEPSTPDELTRKTFLRAAGISDSEEVSLALSTAKKWNMEIDALVDDADWQAKLEKHRQQKANDRATADLKSNPGGKGENQTAEFYIARGAPPTREEVSDRKARAEIIRTMMKSAKSNGKQFYNS